MPKRRTDSLSGKRRAFADNMIAGLPDVAAYKAAREAGSTSGWGTDNSGKRIGVDQLLEDPLVVRYIIERLSDKAVNIKLLGNQCLGVLDKATREDFKCRECGSGLVDPKEAIVAAKAGLDFIVKCDGADMFRDVDRKAKALLTRAEAARAIIGPDPKALPAVLDITPINETEQ